MRAWRLRAVAVCVVAMSVSARAQSITVAGPGQVPGPGVTGARDNAKPKTGTARLRGRVVGGENGAPLRRAIVRLEGGELRDGRMTTTDEEGRWELKDLPAGRYQVSAMKAGYVQLQYGQRRPFEQGRPVEIADAQALENVNFNLPRGSVIAGRVTDEFGEPVAEVMVAAQRYRYFNGQRRMIPVGRFTQTDDGGNFRLYGLAPGDYYVSATLQSFMMAGESDDRSGYSPTYYPGTGNSQQADKITVGVGGESSGIAFSLVPTRTARISGTATDSRGKPMAGAFVNLMEVSEGGTGFMMFGGGNQVHDDGTFSITNVSPGDYLLQARPTMDGDVEVASTPISVSGEDISGVALVGSKGTLIRGRVVFDVQPAAGTVKPSSIGVAAMAKDPSAGMMIFFGGGMRESLADDWTFEVRTMASPVLIRTMRTPPGYSLKTVFFRGEDVTDTGIAAKSVSSINDVEIVLTARSTTVQGAVTDAKGDPAVDYAAVIFAEDSDHWGMMSRRVQLARPDQQGGFVVKQLPPGRYLAAALAYIEDGEESNPELLERLRSVATPFTLAEGERKAVTLKVVEY
jgi:protocatechuate 3,4-dioxygenase beta subunit